MICSCLVPSRKRYDRLKALVESIRLHAEGVEGEDYEILCRSDEDDPITENTCLHLNVHCLVGSRYGGWKDNNRMFGELAEIAKGYWIWILNDDMIVQGTGWDTKLSEAPKANTIVQPSVHRLGGSSYPKDDAGPAPIVPNKCWLEWGMKEIPQPSDTMFAMNARKRGWRTHFLEGITIWHQRPNSGEIEIHRHS